MQNAYVVILESGVWGLFRVLKKNLTQCHIEWLRRVIARWWCNGWTSISWAKRRTCTPSVCVWTDCHWTSATLKNWPSSSLRPTNLSSARSVMMRVRVWITGIMYRKSSIFLPFHNMLKADTPNLTGNIASIIAASQKKVTGHFSFHTSYNHICRIIYPRLYGSFITSLLWNRRLREILPDSFFFNFLRAS